jgi:hypothetical protein
MCQRETRYLSPSFYSDFRFTCNITVESMLRNVPDYHCFRFFSIRQIRPFTRNNEFGTLAYARSGGSVTLNITSRDHSRNIRTNPRKKEPPPPAPARFSSPMCRAIHILIRTRPDSRAEFVPYVRYALDLRALPPPLYLRPAVRG